MNAQQFYSAIDLSTSQALKSGQCSLPEIIGILEMAKISAERVAYQHAMQQQAMDAMPGEKPAPLILLPRGSKLPKR